MRNFFTEKAETWTESSGQLHIYALPNAELNRTLTPYAAALGGLSGVAVQPLEFFHFTVQRLPFMLDEVRAVTPHLVGSMRQQLRALKPFILDIGYPVITDDSVIVRGGDSEEWRKLTRQLRRAIQTVLGDAGLHYAPPTLGPHLTVAYGVGPSDDTEIARRLNSVRTATTRGAESVPHLDRAQGSAALARVRIDSVDLVSVHVHPGAGVYTFDTIAEIAFGH